MAQASGRAKPTYDEPLAVPEGLNKRCDLPPEAYWMPDRDKTPFANRPGFNSTGQDIMVGVNQFRILSISNPDVYQFDVALEPEPESTVVYKKVWKSSVVKSQLANYPNPWLYDERKLAWSTSKVQYFECEVDVGADEGRPGRKNNLFRLKVKQTGKIRVDALRAYLQKKMAWDDSVLECLSFLDHVLRQGPSERMTSFKRTFVNEFSETKRLNNATEAVKGIYSAIRLNESINLGGLGLGVNVDVSNQTFWVGQKFEQLARNFLSCVDRQWENLNYDTMARLLQPVKVQEQGGAPRWVESPAFKALRRLKHLRFHVKHRGNNLGSNEYKLRRFAFDPKYGQQGACAKAVTFEKTMPDGSKKTYNIHDYYLEQYKVKVMMWQLPLIETYKAGFFPMEVCEVHRFNRYPFKLDPSQTQEMIRFAVQRPRERKTEIMNMVQNLEWDKDRYLKHFGIRINPSMQMVKSKLIKNPVVQYGNRSTDPGTTGRWDLRGMKFVKPNEKPLKSWAFVAVDDSVDKPTLANFVRVFKTTYAAHGGKVEKEPLMFSFPRNTPIQKVVEDAYKSCGNANKATPEIIFFVLKDKSTGTYDQLKKNAECRYAIVTQMVQASHVRKAQGQYCSNVCMKVNAKLGGQTSRIAHSGPPTTSAFFKVPTMMIGVDVAHGHGTPGMPTPSMAGMCVSMDKDAAVYAAAVQTNGFRVEILQPTNTHSMLGPLIKKWCQKNGAKPKHVFYVRDGVSEGQFAHVMEFELKEMQNTFREAMGEVPKITVIVATKRHHIRFFPERGDKNGNPLPGTLMEREVTHPYQYDFYLCSHVAIQGTARPVHYNVLHDECQLKPDELQRILYHQCYQYCRSTTPVSLHPAVYYAHLACARAYHHENFKASEPIPTNPEYLILKRPGLMSKRNTRKDSSTTSSQDLANLQPPKLLEPGTFGGRPESRESFANSMWWV